MANFEPRTNTNGILYGEYNGYFYWDHSLNPYATSDWCMANCTAYAYGRALEVGGPAPLVAGAYPSAFRWHAYLANGWTAIPYDAQYVEPGDIIQYGDAYKGISGNHVAFVEDVSGGTFYLTNSNFENRNTSLSMQQICDYFQSTAYLRNRFFNPSGIGYGGTPTYILKNPDNPGPLPPGPGETDVQYPIALPPELMLKVGDAVKIIGTGKASVDGSGNTAYGLGWIRYIQRIYKGAYPFRVGTRDGRWTTGFYKASALEKVQECKTKK